MRKFYLRYSICLLVWFCFVLTSFAEFDKKKLVTAQSAILVDLNKNKILYSKNIHTKRAPASTIKILTALVALEKIGTNADVKISKNAT
ncbi:D-alanyl-D-alanine carboxypeptidase, partial [bacterium]|nr:D-alanyl-D-alanine carboxypeptidase [bacterium]